MGKPQHHEESGVHEKTHHMELGESFENDDEEEYYPLDKAKRLFDDHLN